MAHCLDANVFIEAHQVRYPMDIAAGFWDGILRAARNGSVFSIERVYAELVESGDELSAWATEHHDELFRRNDDDPTQQAIRDVGAAVDGRMPAYRQEAKDLFNAGADPWL